MLALLLTRSAAGQTLYSGSTLKRNLHSSLSTLFSHRSLLMDASKDGQNSERDRKQPRGRGGERGSAKLRGHPRDSTEMRTSKTLSWILRHGSQSEGLAMRPDGYVRVHDLLRLPKMRDVEFAALEQIVQKDNKSRYHLLHEPDQDSGSQTEIWWIRANQGHSLKSVELDLQPINAVSDIPTGTAVHGTTRRAWEIIREQGIRKMTRNHIHLAQGVPGSGVISGMRNSSQILIFVDVQKALDAGIKFHMSANGVVLTEGDAEGFLRPQFFSRVESPDRKPIPGWESTTIAANEPATAEAVYSQEAAEAVSNVDDPAVVKEVRANISLAL